MIIARKNLRFTILSYYRKTSDMKKLYTLVIASCTSLLLNAQNKEKPQLSARTEGLITKLKTDVNADRIFENYAFRTVPDGKN